MKATYLSLALVLCATATGCVVDFPDELPYACEDATDCGGAPRVCASLADGRKYCCNPEPEQCNKLDDDCNGVPDDLGNESCYTGPEPTRGVGACRQGKVLCGNGGTPTCVGEVLPTAETCNGKDDNCDGTVDEGFDFQTGRNNCGRCDQACTDVQDCVAGQCVRRKEITCDNGTDDDSDTFVDCADSDCNSLPCGTGCTCLGGKKAETDCNNGVSDEGADDTANLVDCADPDCDSRSCGAGCICLSGVKGEADCTNTVDGTPSGTPVDDELDGKANCADADCTDKSCGEGCVCRVGVKAEDLCDDGMDNDLDTRIDCADTADCNNKICGLGCQCVSGVKKEVVCSDSLDNDGDGTMSAPKTDCQDSDCNNEVCVRNADGSPENGARCAFSAAACREVTCNDGQDNDRDNQIDCADRPDCDTKPCKKPNNQAGTCTNGTCQ